VKIDTDFQWCNSALKLQKNRTAPISWSYCVLPL